MQMLNLHVIFDYDSGLRFDEVQDTSDPSPMSWLPKVQNMSLSQATVIPISRQAAELSSVLASLLGDTDDDVGDIPFNLSGLSVGGHRIPKEHKREAFEAVRAVVQFCEAEARRGVHERPRGSPLTMEERILCGTDAKRYGRLWMLGAIHGFLDIPALRDVAARGYAAQLRNKTRDEVAEALGWRHPLTARDYRMAIDAGSEDIATDVRYFVPLMREAMEKLELDEKAGHMEP